MALHHGTRLLLWPAGAAGAGWQGAGAAGEPPEDGSRETAHKILLCAVCAYKKQSWQDTEPLVS